MDCVQPIIPTAGLPLKGPADILFIHSFVIMCARVCACVCLNHALFLLSCLAGGCGLGVPHRSADLDGRQIGALALLQPLGLALGNHCLALLFVFCFLTPESRLSCLNLQ